MTIKRDDWGSDGNCLDGCGVTCGVPMEGGGATRIPQPLRLVLRRQAVQVEGR